MDDELKTVLDDLDLHLAEPPAVVETIFAIVDAGGTEDDVRRALELERRAYAMIGEGRALAN